MVWRDFSWRNIAWSYLWQGFNLLSAGGTQAQGKVRCNAIGSSKRHSKVLAKADESRDRPMEGTRGRILPQSPAQSTVLSSSGRGLGGEGKKNSINDRLTNQCRSHAHIHSVSNSHGHTHTHTSPISDIPRFLMNIVLTLDQTPSLSSRSLLSYCQVSFPSPLYSINTSIQCKGLMEWSHWLRNPYLC